MTDGIASPMSAHVAPTGADQPTFQTARRAFVLAGVVLLLSIGAVLVGLVVVGIVGIVAGILGATFATMFAVRAHAVAHGREPIL